MSQKNKYRILTYTHTHTHIWNLDKWYTRTYLQGRNRDTGIEIRLVDTGGRRGLDELRVYS